MRTIELDFCRLDFFDNYFIGTIYEGIIVDIEKSTMIIEKALEHFGKTPFVIISNRIHSFSVNPAVYKYLKVINSLKGFAVVSNSSGVIKNFSIEMMFYNHPHSIHKCLDKAKHWANSIVQD